MGKKRETKGKHFFIYTACLLTIFLLGQACATTTRMHNRWMGYRHLDLAGKLADQGDYEGAVNEAEEVISLSPDAPPGDRALFYMGIIWSHPDNPGRNYDKALQCFQRYVHDFPRSRLREEARAWTGIIKELILCEGKIKDLEDALITYRQQLDALKKIDIGIEKEKRKGLQSR